jgi:hypothetical protein
VNNVQPGDAEEEPAAAERWCHKRYEKEKAERRTSAGSLWAFQLCGYSFPPVEMVGAESLTQVLSPFHYIIRTA